MNVDQILNEIREANLSYLMLAQSLIRTTANKPSTGSASARRAPRSSPC